MSSLLQAPPPSPPVYPTTQTIQSIPLLLPVFIFFLFLFVCFLAIFLFRTIFIYLSSASRQRPGRSGPNAGPDEEPGLDPAIIASFHTLPYSASGGLQEGKCSGECAVCLSEFSGADVVRMLPVCCHVFHQACIDSWLASQTTCPICRLDLKAPPNETAEPAAQEVAGGGTVDSHVIVVDDGAEDQSTETELEQARDWEEGNSNAMELEQIRDLEEGTRNTVSTAEPP